MRLPSTQRLALFAVFLAVCATTGLIAWRTVPNYLNRKFNVNASDYQLPHGAVRFESLKPASAREYLDSQGRILGYAYGERLHFYRPLTEIDPKITEWVVLSEDAKFWAHDGFDLDEIKNSLTKNIESGKLKRGGSTITQQLAKNLFLDKKKSFARKLYEIPWALRLEKDLTKKQMLELYLNVIEWGPGIYGVEAASRHFFDKPAKELAVGQALYLVLIIPNPPRFDLFAHPKTEEFLQKKKSAFVRRLVDEHKIAPELEPNYMSADFGLAPLDRSTRNYPLSHAGNYLGNRTSKTQAYLNLTALLDANLKVARDTVPLTIDRDQQIALEALNEVNAPGVAAHYCVRRQDGVIRALRWLPKNKALDATDPATENLAQINWTELTR